MLSLTKSWFRAWFGRRARFAVPPGKTAHLVSNGKDLEIHSLHSNAMSCELCCK